MDFFDFARMAATSAVILAYMIGIALLIAILGALLEPVCVTYTHVGDSAGRHAYSRPKAVSEGIRKAGRVYRLSAAGWQEVTG